MDILRTYQRVSDHIIIECVSLLKITNEIIKERKVYINNLFTNLDINYIKDNPIENHIVTYKSPNTKIDEESNKV